MRTRHMKNKSRSKSKRHRSLRKKSGGGWFDSTPSDPADDALPWHKKITKSLTNLFSSAPPVPKNVPPPPRPGQPPAQEPVEPPGQNPAPAPAMPAPAMPAPPMQAPAMPEPSQQMAPAAAAPMQPSSSPQFPATENQFRSPAAFGGKRTKKRRNHKKK